MAVDETPVPVLDPGRAQTKTSYFWAIARDDRPWGGKGPAGRSRATRELRPNYRGIVQCDGYAPYKKLAADTINGALCWSHLRREFFKIAERGDAPIATEAVKRIAQIYAIEEDVHGTNAEARRATRLARSRPTPSKPSSSISSQRLSGGSEAANRPFVSCAARRLVQELF